MTARTSSARSKIWAGGRRARARTELSRRPFLRDAPGGADPERAQTGYASLLWPRRALAREVASPMPKNWQEAHDWLARPNEMPLAVSCPRCDRQGAVTPSGDGQYSIEWRDEA